MPLKTGKSRKTISYNIGEMLRSSTFGAGKSETTRQSMASAAAYDKARESGAVLPRKRSKSSPIGSESVRRKYERGISTTPLPRHERKEIPLKKKKSPFAGSLGAGIRAKRKHKKRLEEALEY